MEVYFGTQQDFMIKTLRIDYICQFYVYAQESTLYKRHFLSETSFPGRKISCCQGTVRVSKTPNPWSGKAMQVREASFPAKRKLLAVCLCVGVGEK